MTFVDQSVAGCGSPRDPPRGAYNSRKGATFIPREPEEVYKDQGWVCWDDFLGATPPILLTDSRPSPILTDPPLSAQSQ